MLENPDICTPIQRDLIWGIRPYTGHKKVNEFSIKGETDQIVSSTDLNG